MAIDYDPLVVCVDYRLDGGGYALEQCGRVFKTGLKDLFVGAFVSGAAAGRTYEGTLRMWQITSDEMIECGVSAFNFFATSSVATFVLKPFSPKLRLVAGWYLVEYHVTGATKIVTSIEVRDKPWET